MLLFRKRLINFLYFAGMRDKNAMVSKEIGDAINKYLVSEGLQEVGVQSLKKATDALDYAKSCDNAIWDMLDNTYYYLTPAGADNAADVAKLGWYNGIPTASAGGVPNKRLLNTINKELGTKYKKLREVPFEEAQKALMQKYGDSFVDLPQHAGGVPEIGIPHNGDIVQFSL